MSESAAGGRSEISSASKKAALEEECAETLQALLQSGAAQQSTAADLSTAEPPTKRRRNTPQETCPYCNHIYTVRDGLSTKTDSSGKRLHMRKCQCREKTPPCRNCPICKEQPDIMRLNEPTMQFQLCQLRLKCEICACRCPGAGKWVETDPDSRSSYAHRAQQRHGQMAAVTSVSGAPSMPQGLKGPVVAAGRMISESTQHTGVHWYMLPAGGSVQSQHPWGIGPAGAAQVLPGPTSLPAASPHAPPTSAVPLGTLTFNSNGPSTATIDLLHCHLCIAAHANHKEHGAPQQRTGSAGQVIAAMQQRSLSPTHAAASDGATPEVSSGPQKTGKGPTVSTAPRCHAANEPLPEPVQRLVYDVIETRAGVDAAAAVTGYLKSQFVCELDELQYIEFQWLRDALEPQGVPAMLLNKLQRVAAQRASSGND